MNPRNTLPTLDSFGSRISERSEESTSGSQTFLGSTNTPLAMLKRSPYLSAMASTSKESFDLVEQMSRAGPTPAAGASSMTPTKNGGAPAMKPGRSDFFNLKRRSLAPPTQQFASMMTNVDPTTVTPVSSTGTAGTFTEEDAFGNKIASASLCPGHPGEGQQQQHVSNKMPSIRSSLRIGGSRANLASADVQDMAAVNAAAESGMKGSRSVTFATATKRGSVTMMTQPEESTENESNAGFGTAAASSAGAVNPLMAMMMAQQGNGQKARAAGGGQYSAAAMMRKSQSMFSPNHGAGMASMAGAASPGRGGGAAIGNKNEAAAGGNSQFPIYLGKLDGGGEEGAEGVEGSHDAEAEATAQMNLLQQRKRSRSVQTLKYYYQNNAMSQQVAVISEEGDAPGTANSTMGNSARQASNITFKDVLDVGDGETGDLNSQQRNQQWKDFRAFSAANPLLQGAARDPGSDQQEAGEGAARSEDDAKMEGVEGTIVGNQQRDTAVSPGAPSSPLSGTKRTLTPTGVATQNSGHPSSHHNNDATNQPLNRQQHLFGAHRASVSVNDLAVFRRAAARMQQQQTGGGVQSGGGGGGNDSNWTASALPPQQQPPSMMGGDRVGAPTMANQQRPLGGLGGLGGRKPSLVAMMASKSSAGLSGLNASVRQQQRQDLFSRTGMGNAPVNMMPTPMAQNQGATMGGNSGGTSMMGRRAMTVGAGLAYGGANWQSGTNIGKGGMRLSRFNLGALDRESQESILSMGSSAGITASSGQNAEW